MIGVSKQRRSIMNKAVQLASFIMLLLSTRPVAEHKGGESQNSFLDAVGIIIICIYQSKVK